MYNNAGSSGQSSGNSGQDFQTQKSRSDIKNVIPLDLYECMEYASHITTALIVDNKVPPRHIKHFYQSFFKLFHFTEDLLSEKLRKDTRIWFRDMFKQINKTEMVAEGVNLYLKYYHELGELGFVTLYEGVIKPDFETLGIPVDDADEIQRQVREELGLPANVRR